MAADLIRYDLLVQDALRAALREVLAKAAREGLPGEHHFYISFRTHARGIKLSQRMRDRYPDEMTIVLQHQFWDLKVSEQAFEVGLSFQNISEMLTVPFEAVTRFADPAAGFELQFAIAGEVEAAPELPLGATEAAQSQDIQQELPLLRAEAAKGPGEKLQQAEQEQAAPLPQSGTKVVSIDAFRKKN
ncbi:MAG: hypothetical protein J2P49_01500 [Methylocapsa sp.]|nr:hypothetical protein [Methylocapsa sp.]